jgi:hypothetical protein
LGKITGGINPMRYFTTIDENPESPNYESVRALFRFEITDTTVVTERWIGGGWVDYPDMITFSGIGGDNNFKEIDESEVDGVVTQLKQRRGNGVQTETEIAETEASDQVGFEVAEEEEYRALDQEKGEPERGLVESEIIPELEPFVQSQPTDKSIEDSPEQREGVISVAVTDQEWLDLAIEILGNQEDGLQSEIARVESDLREGKETDVEISEEVVEVPAEEEVVEIDEVAQNGNLEERHGVHIGQEGREGEVGGSQPGFEHVGGGENWKASGFGAGIFVLENPGQRSAAFEPTDEGFEVRLSKWNDQINQFLQVEAQLYEFPEEAIEAGNEWVGKEIRTGGIEPTEETREMVLGEDLTSVPSEYMKGGWTDTEKFFDENPNGALAWEMDSRREDLEQQLGVSYDEFVIATKNPKEGTPFYLDQDEIEGPWRITYVSGQGEPIGHQHFDNARKIMDFVRNRYKASYNINPAQALIRSAAAERAYTEEVPDTVQTVIDLLDKQGKFQKPDGINEELFSGAEPSEEPTVDLVGGLSSSGKTTYIRENLGENAIKIEPEEIKASIEGYEGWKSALFADEASQIIGTIIERAVAEKYNLVIESNFSSIPVTTAIVEAFQNEGYIVNFHYVDIPMQEAMERAIERFDGPTGRYTSVVYLATQDGKPLAVFESIKTVADNWELVSNRQPKGEEMTPLGSGQMEQEQEFTVSDEEFDQLREAQPVVVGRTLKKIFQIRHGDHVQQEGRKGQRGGSQPGYTHVGGMKLEKAAGRAFNKLEGYETVSGWKETDERGRVQRYQLRAPAGSDTESVTSEIRNLLDEEKVANQFRVTSNQDGTYNVSIWEPSLEPEPEFEEATQVGITSAREGVESGQVFEDMREFEDAMSKLEGVKDLNVQPGLGGWEGGREPTWIVQYRGDGDAENLIAETARDKDQDAALIFRPAELTEEGSPITDFVINEHINPRERSRIEEEMGDIGIGGWTWMRTEDGRRLIRTASVPQWGGTEESHEEHMQFLGNFLEGLGMSIRREDNRLAVDVLERENNYGISE